PMINCAIVPTTISDKAVEMRSQIESRLAISASPTHNAARAQTLVIHKPPRDRRTRFDRARVMLTTRTVHKRNLEAVGAPGHAPTRAKRLVGVISLFGGYGEPHPR